jgi:hypothetical protein
MSLMNNASFCQLFCARHKCQPAEFDDKVFRLCFYPKRYYLGRLLALFDKDLFDVDYALIEAVKAQTSMREIRTEIESYRFNNRPRGLFRGWLKVRISGQRLLNEAESLLPRAG